MRTALSALFGDFDRGRTSRRQLLRALGIAVAMRPAAALAQGQCGGARAGTPAARRASIGHISFGITPFDPDDVKAELDKRGLNARVDTGGRGDIHTSPYKSYHTTTPNGIDLQISATTHANRDA